MSLTQVNGIGFKHPLCALKQGICQDPRVDRHRDINQMCTSSQLLATDVEGGAATASAPVSMKELLSNRGVFIGCMIFLLQQFSGVNSVVYFSSSVFAKVQSSPALPSTTTPLSEILSTRCSGAEMYLRCDTPCTQIHSDDAIPWINMLVVKTVLAVGRSWSEGWC